MSVASCFVVLVGLDVSPTYQNVRAWTIRALLANLISMCFALVGGWIILIGQAKPLMKGRAHCHGGREAWPTANQVDDFGGESLLDTFTRQSLVQRYYHYQWQ